MPVPPYVLDARTPELVQGLARIRDELDVPGPPAAAVVADAEAAAARVLGGLESTIGRDRVDARDWHFVTIDPPGSRDLDQALHLERRPGGYRVRYAIADLAAFVAEGTPLDADLWDRGVTLYLPDERAPLHPPVLGEGAASLLPDEDRPALLWTIDLDRDGVAGDARLERAVVRSRAQLTYAGVQSALDGGGGGPVEQLLAEVGPLRQVIEGERGGVSLDLPTQRVVVDDDGRYRLEHEQVVPVMGWNAQISLLAGMTGGAAMLEAGIGLLRTLPPPRDDVVRIVRRTAAALGVRWPAEDTYAERVRTLDGDQPDEAALLVLAARGLRGAGYLALVPGEPVAKDELATHAAVAAPYAHVTAPLRRLADRHANEVCLALLDGGDVPPAVAERLPDLPKAMAQARGREGAVARAVVDLVEALVLRSRVGQVLDATVVASGDGRSTIVLPEPAVQTEVAGQLPLGEPIEVRVEAVDPVARSVDLRPV